MENCIFCKIINRELPAHIISENDNVIVFLSLENHPLVIPKKHIKNIYELDPETGAEIMKELIKTAKAIKNGLGCDGVYITQANEPAAGQDVLHIHFHVYPRWQAQQINKTEKMEETEYLTNLEKIKKALI